MKAVLQRVNKIILNVDGQARSRIGKGLAVYLGVEKGDTKEQADFLAKKIVTMRIFENDKGKLDFSVLDKGYEIMVISQFTLCADCGKGHRPDFTHAESPSLAENLYLYFAQAVREQGVKTETGVFGADMKIEQLNDGPLTIILEK